MRPAGRIPGQMGPDLTIQDAVRRIVETPAPVLLLDTCAVLDVVRAPLRKLSPAVTAAREIVCMTRRSPAALYTVTCQLVDTEWRDHHEPVAGEVNTDLDKLERSLAVYLEICKSVEIEPPQLSLERVRGLPSVLLGLAEQLMHSAVRLRTDQECQLRAHCRSIDGLRPARKGGQSKDCDIIEHYLMFTSQLRQSGVGLPCVFVSSNSADYCLDRNKVHPDLMQVFSQADLTFASELGSARYKLGLTQ